MKQLFNWDVVTKPNYDSYGNVIEGYNRIVRNDNGKTLHIAKNGYKPITNFMFNTVVDSFKSLGWKVNKLGTINGGKKIYAQFQHNDMASEIVPNDKNGLTKGYATLVNSHDGTSAFKIFVTIVRMFCDNQFHYINRNANSGISIKHTLNYENKLNDFINSMDNIIVAQNDIMTKMKEMSDMTTFDNVNDYTISLHQLEKKPRPIKEMNKKTGHFDIVDWTPPQYSTRGVNIMREYDSLWDSYSNEMDFSNWGLFNCTTHYVDHDLTDKRGKGYGLFGSGMELKGRAFKLLTA